MFLGEYTHTVDPKGRVAIPAKFREKLVHGAIITKGFDRCLFVLGEGEWQKFVEEKLSGLPIGKSSSRAFSRHLLSGAVDVEFDVQGRILIPGPLREYAGLSKNAVIIGVGTRLEVWDAEEWNAYKTKTECAADEIAEKLGDLGI